MNVGTAVSMLKKAEDMNIGVRLEYRIPNVGICENIFETAGSALAHIKAASDRHPIKDVKVRSV